MSYKDQASVAPYYDDYNPDLNFLRILSVPGRAVQSRELTQLQTILQNQIASMANNLFKNNSTILGGGIKLNTKKPGCKVYDLQVIDRVTGTLGTDPVTALLPLASFVGRTFVNQDPLNLSAPPPTKSLTVTHALAGPSGSFYLYFSFAGASPASGELFFDKSGSSGVAIKMQADTFFGLAATSDPGVIYHDGEFVSVLRQETIVGNGKPTVATGSVQDYCIGYRFEEDVVTENDAYYGNLLVDPAAGFPNHAAPGAHRYRITPVLDFYDKADEGTLDPAFTAKFALMIEVRNGEVVLDNTGPRFNVILDVIAKRAYDTNGNFTVKDFKLTVSDDDADPANLALSVSPGTAFVLGYEVSHLATTRLSLPRARDTIGSTNVFATAGNHFYFSIRNAPSTAQQFGVGQPMVRGQLDLTPGTTVRCYDTSFDQSTGNTVARASSNLLGTFRVHSVVKVGSETRIYGLNASSALIQNFPSVKSIRNSAADTGTYGESLAVVRTATAGDIAGGLVSNSIVGTAISGGGFTEPLVYPISGATVIKDFVSNQSTFQEVIRFSGTFAAGTVTFTAPASNMSFFDTTEDGVCLVQAVNTGSGDWTQLFLGTDFTSVTVDNVSNPATLTLSTANANYTSSSVVAYLRVSQDVAQPKSKVLSTGTKTATITPSTTDSIQLNDCDILSIDSVAINTNQPPGVSTTSPYFLTADQLARLKLDNGQRDDRYDIGSLAGFKLLNAYANPSAATSITITYKYFTHVRTGAADYFCVNSYPFTADQLGQIPDFRSSAGKSYNMANCVDFRSKVTDLLGRPVIVPLSRFVTDTEEYMGRIDKVCIDQDGNFVIAKGVSSFSPQPPNELPNAMTLAVVALNPYTYDKADLQIKPRNNRRYTMADIGVLDTRISSLETYAAMSLLEQSANNTSIIDAETGFDKFKNGIFADPFTDHGRANKDDVEYRIAIEPPAGGIICPFEQDAFELLPLAGSNTVQLWANTATLVPTSEIVISDNHTASDAINLNPYLFYTWNGKITLNPAVDTWKDVVAAPAIHDTVGSFDSPGDNPNGVVWNDWQVNWVGTSSNQYSNVHTSADGSQIIADKTVTETDTATTETRSGTITTSVPYSTTTVENRVINVSEEPYMRSTTVRINATGLRQGMVVLGFIDNYQVPLTPAGSQWTQTNPSTGYPITDSQGGFQGFFTVPKQKIPAGTVRFALVDQENTSSASTTYTSRGILETTQQTITTVRSTQEVTETVTQTAALPQPLTEVVAQTTSTVYLDPLAQSFLVNQPGGAFVASVEVFFKQVPLDTASIDYQPVSLYLVEMENGTPTQRVIPMSRVTLRPDQCNYSSATPALGSTIFTFTDPIYLHDQTEYAFVLFSNSRQYVAWISTLGEQDIFSFVPPGGTATQNQRSLQLAPDAQLAYTEAVFTTSDGQKTVQAIDQQTFLPRVDPTIAFRGTNVPGTGIAEQPNLGSLFLSKNSSTWTPQQMSNMTFRVRAYTFPENSPQVLTLRDSKQDVNGNEKYAGPGLPLNQQISTAMLNVGDLRVPGTTIDYKYAFHQGPSAGNFTNIENRENEYLTAEYVLDKNLNPALQNNYTAVATLKSSSKAITPVIDLQQCRLVGIHYDLVAKTGIVKNDDGSTISSCYDAGTYVSQNVSLLNHSDGLRVILDQKLPGGSFANVFYRTSTAAPSYFPIAVSTVTDTSLIGKTCNLVYVSSDGGNLGATGNPGLTGAGLAFSGTEIQCIVTNVDGSNVYVRSATEISPFKAPSDVSLTNVGYVLMLTETDYAAMAALSSAQQRVVAYSGATDYSLVGSPKYVLSLGRLWKVGPDYGGAGFAPAIGGTAWIDIPYAQVGGPIVQGGDVEWRPMALAEAVNPSLNTGKNFIEYSYSPKDKPEDFTEFSVKVQLYSLDRVNVPEGKNLRAIAVI